MISVYTVTSISSFVVSDCAFLVALNLFLSKNLRQHAVRNPKLAQVSRNLLFTSCIVTISLSISATSSAFSLHLSYYSTKCFPAYLSERTSTRIGCPITVWKTLKLCSFVSMCSFFIAQFLGRLHFVIVTHVLI